tara:strand:- start:27 stop:896 length:870 start_codon:yes stop_codon:yes gene_type:complete
MSDFIFKVKKPLTIKSGTGVSLSESNTPFTEKDFDGSNSSTIKVGIGQAVGTTDSVVFNTVTLSPSTLVIGSGSSNQMNFADGQISGSDIQFQNDLTITQNLNTTNIMVVQDIISSSASSFGSRIQSNTHNTGSTRWGESLTQKQFATGSFEVTGSFSLNKYEIKEISNDTNLTDESPNALITENVAKTHLATLKPDRDYLQKSFTHTGSFVNSSTASFTAITASAPTSLSTTSENDFMFFINGMVIENDALTISQKTSTNLELRLDTNSLGYILESSDEVIGFGKFNS